MTAPAFVLLNPAARGGTGGQRFARLRPDLEARFRIRTVPLDRDGAWILALRRALTGGTRRVIAAGGDGTVHALANALLDLDAPRDTVLGALGLGSSNDYHKPVRKRIRGVPARLDVAAATPRDLLVARWEQAGVPRREAVVVSASVGLVACANARFNEGDWLLDRLKRRWPPAAIAYAALATLVRQPALRARIELPTSRWRGRLASLSILETPHLSGSLHYDLPAAPDDAAVTVAVIERGPRRRLVRTLIGLRRGRFDGAPGTHHWVAPRLRVQLDEPAPLELDGELRTARAVCFHVLPRRLLACP